MTGVDNNLETM